jgi:ABC-type multidrug transport system fused ATPase/permease subunit
MVDVVTGTFDFSSFLVATVIFILLLVLLGAILKFFHHRLFPPHARAQQEMQSQSTLYYISALSSLALMSSYFLLVQYQRFIAPVSEPYAPPPYFSVQIEAQGAKKSAASLPPPFKVSSALFHL